MHVPIADRAAFADATDLLQTYGEAAAAEAGERARKSRDAGNLIAFCRWRQAKRAVSLIAGDHAADTIH